MHSELDATGALHAPATKEHISDRCPSCGHQSLFIGSGGWLTCSWIECRQPSVGRAVAALLDADRHHKRVWAAAVDGITIFAKLIGISDEHLRAIGDLERKFAAARPADGAGQPSRHDSQP